MRKFFNKIYASIIVWLNKRVGRDIYQLTINGYVYFFEGIEEFHTVMKKAMKRERTLDPVYNAKMIEVEKNPAKLVMDTFMSAFSVPLSPGFLKATRP